MQGGDVTRGISNIVLGLSAMLGGKENSHLTQFFTYGASKHQSERYRYISIALT